uniref:DDE-1 domain-containing protein n=1 Tax=Acrobeloides nanus TaxID=290746 RepID=A0A914EK56_9BILA
MFGQGKRGYQIAQDMNLHARTVNRIINVPNFIQVDISPQRNNGEWPPNSPDLNVMDYSIWSILEAEVCSKPHQSIEALKKSLVKAWNAIPQDIIDKAVDDFLKCLKKCIEAGGGHFENK